jgi:hypothetical protein
MKTPLTIAVKMMEEVEAVVPLEEVVEEEVQILQSLEEVEEEQSPGNRWAFQAYPSEAMMDILEALLLCLSLLILKLSEEGVVVEPMHTDSRGEVEEFHKETFPFQVEGPSFLEALLVRGLEGEASASLEAEHGVVLLVLHLKLL